MASAMACSWIWRSILGIEFLKGRFSGDKGAGMSDMKETRKVLGCGLLGNG